MKILILNGPNLNRLGQRAPEIYGNLSFEEYLTQLKNDFPADQFDYFQSNIEGELIDRLQASPHNYHGVIINAGGYTHTSVALGDAVADLVRTKTPCIEVHISSILSREEFRHISMIAPYASGTIMGFGLDSYRLGIEALRLIHLKN